MIIKKYISLALAIALITSFTLGDIRTSAASSKDYEYDISNSKAIITRYIGSGGAITIPSKLGGYPVVRIAGMSFEDNEIITSIVIPEGITSIGLFAFYDCVNLTTIKLPSTLTIIDASAFEGCKKLSDFVLPSHLYELGNCAFSDCESLTSVSIPGSVVTFEDFVFKGCKGITQFNVDESSAILSSNEGVLFNKTGTILIEYPEGSKETTYIIPSEVTEIAERAFYNSQYLTMIKMPDSVMKMGWSTFSECKMLTSITLSNNITTINEHTFYGCKGLNSITIPNSVITIGESAFYECMGLTSITIPNSVTTIEGGSFNECTGLTSITIPNSVTNFGGSFAGCTSLTSIKLPDGLDLIPSGCFRNCAALESITVPEGVKTIDSEAFEGCIKLTDITISKNVTNIGDSVFNLCSSMTAINVDVDNTKYSSLDGVLYNKSQTKVLRYPGGKEGTVSIPSTVWKIGDDSFSYCINITKITIPKNVTVIGLDAFYRCKNLTNITFSEGLKTIYGAFWGCTSLKSVSLPKSLRLMDNSTFEECWALTKINVAAENPYLSSVNGVVFSKDKKVLKVYPAGRRGRYVIPKTTVRIDVGAFMHCMKLTSIVFQNGLKVIGNEAFAECTGLRSLTIPKTVTKIEDGAFLLCPDLKRITFLGNAPIMGDGAFENSGSLKWYYIYGNKGFGKHDNPIIPKPTIKVSQQSSTSIKISWSNFKNATGYKVYRTTSRGGAYKTIKTVNGTSIIDTGLKRGKTYYYKVRVFAKLSATKYLFSNYSNAKRINMTTVIYGK